MEAPRIFVVIPVYNVENYLRPCVESLQAQTFTDWQAVLVDDGSTDSSGALCDELAAQEPRLQVIHQSNGGLAAARNTGMSVMRGEALAFLDSDDVIPPEFLQELWNAFEGNDLVVCDAEEHDLNGGINLITGQWAHSEGSVTEYIHAILYAEIPPLLALCCWNKLYRIGLLRETGILQRSDYRRGEDSIFNMQLLSAVQRVAYTRGTAYHYQRREGSLMDKHPELIAPAQALQLQYLAETAVRCGLFEDADFRAHFAQYRMNAFFFAVYQITDAQLGRKRTVQLLDELLARRIVCGGDIAAARPHTLPWLLLRAAVATKSGFGLLCWLVLSGKLHWA